MVRLHVLVHEKEIIHRTFDIPTKDTPETHANAARRLPHRGVSVERMMTHYDPKHALLHVILAYADTRVFYLHVPLASETHPAVTVVWEREEDLTTVLATEFVMPVQPSSTAADVNRAEEKEQHGLLGAWWRRVQRHASALSTSHATTVAPQSNTPDMVVDLFGFTQYFLLLTPHSLYAATTTPAGADGTATASDRPPLLWRLGVAAMLRAFGEGVLWSPYPDIFVLHHADAVAPRVALFFREQGRMADPRAVLCTMTLSSVTKAMQAPEPACTLLPDVQGPLRQAFVTPVVDVTGQGHVMLAVDDTHKVGACAAGVRQTRHAVDPLSPPASLGPCRSKSA